MNVRMRYLMMRNCSTFIECMLYSKINELECWGGRSYIVLKIAIAGSRTLQTCTAACGGCIEMNVRMRYLMMRDCSTFMVCMIYGKINELECWEMRSYIVLRIAIRGLGPCRRIPELAGCVDL